MCKWHIPAQTLLDRGLYNKHWNDSPPLCDVDRLYDPGDLIDKGDGAGDVVQDLHVPDLFPRHRHVLHQLQHRVRHVLQGAEVKVETTLKTSTGLAVGEEYSRIFISAKRSLISLKSLKFLLNFTQDKLFCRVWTFYLSCRRGHGWFSWHVLVAYLPSEHQ